MPNNIKKVLKREIKLLWQDKRTLLMVFFLPILYTAFFGYLYNAKLVRDLNTAVVNNSPSQLSRTIVDGFRSSERFNVKYELKNEEEILPLMEAGEIDVAIVIPPEFNSSLKKSKASEVFIGVNASNMIVGNGAMASALQIIETYSTGVALKKYESQGFSPSQAMEKAMPLNLKFRPWYNPSFNYLNFLLLGIMIVAIQQITMMVAANSLAGEVEDGTLCELFKCTNSSIFSILLGKGFLYLLAGFLSLAGSAFFVFKVFKIPLRGDFLHILLLSGPFLACIIIWGFLAAVVSTTRTEATRLIMLLPYPTFLLSGFTWPLLTMPAPLQQIAKAIPLTHYADLYRNIALMGVGLEQIKGSIIWLTILALCYLVPVYIIFRYRWSGIRTTERETVEKCLETC